MLLNEIKILRELDREGHLAGALNTLGVSLRASVGGNAKDVNPKMYPLLQKHIVRPPHSAVRMDSAELKKEFGDDDKSIEALKGEVNNIKAILSSMANRYEAVIRKPEFNPVAAASTIGGGPFPATQAWINAINKEAKNLIQSKHAALLKSTSSPNATIVYNALKKVSTANTFAQEQANALEASLSATPPTPPATVAVHAENFLTLLNLMKENCDEVLKVIGA